MSRVRLASFLAVAGVLAALCAPASAATVKVNQEPIYYKGMIDLGKLGGAQGSTTTAVAAFPQGAALAAPPTGTRFRSVDNVIAKLRHAPGAVAHASDIPLASGQVPREFGWAGLNGLQQAQANGGLDLEPPDQGLCAGNAQVGEFVNNAFVAYDPNGDQLTSVVPAYKMFRQPSTAFMSDPRCYFDAATDRWFLTEFTVGSASVPSVQYIDVSNSSNLLGTYSVWAFVTTDRIAPGCPCFGDYDQFGLDNNGVYIATNEFSDTGSAFNGAVVYALSKQLLETYANTGIPPTLFAYHITADPFGQPYHVSPAATPPGARYAPNTEYFVESNSDANSDNHLVVYALSNTSLLAQPAPPPMTNTEVTSEPYAFPPDAVQRPGPTPLASHNQDPEGQLQADFNAIQEVTYTAGQLYAEADTAIGTGNPQRDGVAWFVITPKMSGSKLTATIAHQGYVNVAAENLLYPVIGVDAAGRGYLAMSMAGPGYYPSATYEAFTPRGPSGPIYVAARGAYPEDSFTCYAAFVGPNYGGCRWGDYSMAVAMGKNVYMATEYVPDTSRDYLTNWGTFVWRAPTP